MLKVRSGTDKKFGVIEANSSELFGYLAEKYYFCS